MNVLSRHARIDWDPKQNDLIFQILSWKPCDYEYEDENEDNDDEENTNGNQDKSKYIVKVFGVTINGYSVSVNILNYTPYFFIKVPFRVNDFTCVKFKEFLLGRIPTSQKKMLLNVKKVLKKDFFGFHNGEKFSFIRFTFRSQKTFKTAIKIFQKPVSIPGIPPQKYKLYESNIEPFLRMVHIRDIEPSGWIKIPKDYYESNSDILSTKCQIDVNCNWKSIMRYDHDSICPLVVASFDLECSSSHGDFPVPIKDYRKVAQELMQKVDKDSESEELVSEILSIFKTDVDGKLSKVFPKFKISENTLSEINGKLQRSIDEILGILRGKLVYIENVLKSPGREAKDKITKDDTIKSLITYFNNIGLPQLKGDPIIQIGTTFHKYGEKSCCFKSIITLGTCDDIPGVDVISCDTEADMILQWCKMINKTDPDVITGYNIFGFDFTYIYQRAQELGIDKEVCRIGRIHEITCPFVEKTLSSSALGDNIMKYIDMDGRVIIDLMKVVQRDHKLDSYKLDTVANHFMKMNKHDVHPNDIFRLFKGTSADRKTIAEYCVQDCELCNLLMIKLETLANNIGMSNVCFVPLSYIFLRGQSIKIFSLVSKQCREDDFLIPSLSKPWGEKDSEEEDEEGYEGAIVLPPKTGIYIDYPITVLDYASLYPSSMISENLSHDTIVLNEKYDNIEGVEYLDISYDLYEGIGNKKRKIGEKKCRFVQTKEKGVLPRILMKLLKQRKETRKKMEYQTLELSSGNEVCGLLKDKGNKYVLTTCGGGPVGEYDKEEVRNIRDTYNSFQKAVLDGLQLAYKVTANSLYGQTGARMSAIYMKEIAACTTATGRKMIMLAKDYLEKNYNADIIYGDTDSLFIKFPHKDENGNPLLGKDALLPAILKGQEASDEFKKVLKEPHNCEYEKVFWPMILFSKKRYVANKYEFDDAHFKQQSMGIVLKRRDNANIVKKVYGGIIDIILNNKDIPQSISFLEGSLNDFIQGKYPMEDLVISKSLKSHYLNPEMIAHKVLADRMKERDPGSAPQVNDRIQYVYITTCIKKGEKMLQGNRIETVEFIQKNKLTPDYEFYISNQIMKPVLQLYSLVLEDLPGYHKGPEYYKNMYKKVLREKLDSGDDQVPQAVAEKKAQDRIQDLREDEVKSILFDKVLMLLKNKKEGNRLITDFFKCE